MAKKPSIETILKTWLTPKQVAEMHDMTESGVRDLCDREALPAEKIAGRWYIDPKVAAAYKPLRRGPKPKGHTEG